MSFKEIVTTIVTQHDDGISLPDIVRQICCKIKSGEFTPKTHKQSIAIADATVDLLRRNKGIFDKIENSGRMPIYRIKNLTN